MSNASRTITTSNDPVDYELVFASEPVPSMLVGIDDRFVILAASDAYLELAKTSRPNLVGKSLLEWLGAAGPDSQLRASLERARDGRQTDTMATGPDGHRIVHRPVLGEGGEVRYLIHRVEGASSEDAPAQLDAIFRQAPVAIAILQGPSHIVELANPMMLEVWGRTNASEVLGRPVFEAIAEAAGHGFEQLLAEVRASGRAFVGRELPVTLKALESGRNETRYVDFVYEPLRAPDGSTDRIIAVGTDVTESVLLRHKISQEASAELRASEDRLRLVADAALVGTWAVDASGEVFADPQVVDLFDLPPGGNYTMDDFLARVAVEDRDWLSQTLDAALAGANDGRFDAEYQSAPRLDGTLKWLHARGKVDFDEAGRFKRFIGTVADVTLRKEAELERERLLQEVAHSGRRLHAQLMQAPVGVSVVSGPDHVFQLANARYLEMTGRKDIVGKSFRAAFPELHEDAPIFGMLDTIYRTGLAYTAEEYRVRLDRKGTGELEDVFFQFTSQPVHDGSEDVKDILTVSVDVTAQVEARNRIEALIRELKIADVRKDEFLATLAHELRNPMAAISTALSLLDRAEGDPARAGMHRETAWRQIKNLTRLVDDMLDVARINRGTIALRKDEVDLAAVVQGAVAATRPLFEERGHELTVTVAPGAFRTLADGTRLEQVVANLLTNAARYTDPGGQVAVRLAHEDVEGAPWAVLRVRDSGRGIPADMLDKVFDLFTQVSPTIDRGSGGLGLGLTFVKRLVEMHGGTVAATSDGPGLGSEFAVRLPMPDLMAETAELPVVNPTFRKRRVLIVEDSEDVRETLKEFVELLGHEVFVAEDGVIGVARLVELAPDVALVDVGLPGIDGYEVARRARATAAGRKLMVVALTGYGGPEVRARAEAAGFDLHVTKPVNLDWLSEFLSRADRRE